MLTGRELGSSVMAGKYDFPEVLPQPPSSPPGDTLLAPEAFLVSSDGIEETNKFYAFNPSLSDFNPYGFNYTDVNKESVMLMMNRHQYGSHSSTAAVMLPQTMTVEDYHFFTRKQDAELLFREKEFVEGKEVVTLTTSHVTSTSNVLSTSLPGLEGHCSVTAHPKKKSSSPAAVVSQQKMNISRYNNDTHIIPNSVGEERLLTPETFVSKLPHSGHSFVASPEDNAEYPLGDKIGIDMEERMKEERDMFGPQDALLVTRQQSVQRSLEETELKSSSVDPKSFLTPDKLVQQYTGAVRKDGRQGAVTSVYGYYGNTCSGPETDLTSDTEDDLEEMEDEEDQKDEERQSHQQATSMYETARRPPIGVFWDIENCQVPKGLSATHVVQAIRSRFFTDHREAEFMCVCDTLKEHSKILEELNDAQVNVMHVGSTVKNAADDKLLQSMRRFADIHGPGATIVLISGDSNFATELYDLRYRKNLRVILVHNAHAQDSLKLCAHETALFTDVTQQLPQRTLKPKVNCLPRSITVRNLPEDVEESAVRHRLRRLSANCGGKVGRVRTSSATIHFQTPELAARAKKRLDGEYVFGSRIYCNFGKIFDKEGSPRVDSSGSCPLQLGREKDFLETFKTGGSQTFQSSQPTMGEVGAPTLSWRVKDSVCDLSSLHQSTSAFKSYGKSSGTTLPQEQFTFPRIWRNSGCRTLSQSNVGTVNGGIRDLSQNYSLHNGDSILDPTSGQPLYLDKTPDQFKKGRPQKVQFRMSSPPSFSAPLRNQDLCSFDISPRVRSPSPQMWSGFSGSKNVWSPAAIDFSPQVMYGLRELALGEQPNSEAGLGSVGQAPVELQVTNLDQTIDARDMKHILFTVFRDHVMVLHVSVFVQSDGNLAATLRVPSPQDAQYAISQLHRKKIGTKRIIISYVNHNQPSPELKRSKVVALLQEVPGKKLPLFKFRELYEKRYHETIGVSEMYNMRDIVTVSDNSTGRMLSLHPEFRHVHSPVLPEYNDDDDGSTPARYCKMHSNSPDESVGWAERDHNTSLPNVNLTLRVLAASIHSLLQSHSGALPLASLLDCYQAEVGPLEECEEGVPLEHLVSCLPGICILTATAGYKYIRWVENKVTDEAEELARCVSPPLIGQLALFSRELVDLIKTFPHCRLPFSRFIPAYHHHFGRQCRVADYGFTKLADLFDALPHIIQVLGEGNKRMLTLSHRAQIKRFSSDLLRVLKGQPAKSVTLDSFPTVYEKTLSKQWNVIDYGVCYLDDLLAEVGETTVIITRSGRETTIAIPKREQTPDEIERTRQFAAEVVELLRHSPQCKMQFNRFIPAYHHHFGRQCKVADYGFTKLIELFEAIPDVLQLVETGGEPLVTLVDRGYVHEVMVRARRVLWDTPSCSAPLDAFIQAYTHTFNSPPNIEVIRKDLEDVMVVEGDGSSAEISLVPLQVFARDLLTLLHEAGGRMLLPNVDQAYLDRFGLACRPATFGFPNLVALVQALGDLVVVRGRGTKRILVLNRDTAPPLPFPSPGGDSTQVYGEGNGMSVRSEMGPPPASQLPPPHKVASHPQCDYQHLIPDNGSSGHLVMSVNPPVSHQSFQPSSPVVYPGSPAPAGGSVIWGQMWSPQYPVMPPLSPAHYMVSTIPMNWGSVSPSPVGPVSSNSSPAPFPSNVASPISINTLDELSNQGCKETELLNVPPCASELPSPEMLTQVSTPPPISLPEVPPYNEQQVGGEDESSNDTWSSVTSESATAAPSGPTKLQTKRRIAAQFNSS